VATWHLFELRATGRRFVMGTTHLEAVSGATRRKSALLIRNYVTDKIRRLGQDTPLFLTGDFNAVASSPELDALFGVEARGPRLYDAWREAAPTDSTAAATFRGLGPLRHLGRVLLGPRRIDYVLYRPRLEVARVERIDFDRLVRHEMARPSDHFPVVADFLLPAVAPIQLQQSA
jgi:endonuclease/exonuclease/phosphatase family metal-dependent hydrolase